MKLDKIYKIVANEVDATVPSEQILAWAKEIKAEFPYDEEEVIEILEELDDSDDDFEWDETETELDKIKSEMDDDSMEEEDVDNELY